MPSASALRSRDPERLGSYRLTGRLGEGGQGVVFLGETPDGALVAVKLLRSALGDDPEARGRFMRELETAKRVARSCTAAVLDADVDGEHPYIVSEYVDGPSLHEVVFEQGPRRDGALERLAIGTATALVMIHRAGIVHRDFKPRNVLLGQDGPRVIDFGIARALDADTFTSGAPIGTPAYMSPEQLTGDRVGPPADMFAWAATMAFASSGRPLFGDDTMPAVINRILNEDPDVGRLSGALRDVVVDCLRKDPALRPTAAVALSRLLGEDDPWRTGPLPSPSREHGTPTAPSGSENTVRMRRRGRIAAALTAAVVAAAALATAAFVVLNDKAERKAGADPSATASKPVKPVFTAPYAGNWRGTLRQSDGKKLVALLTLPKGRRQGTITYPGQGCSGRMALMGSAPGTLTLREEITTGAARCVDSGTITLSRRKNGGLAFNYSGSEAGASWAVVGRLTRV
ncbi:serine/threonine-protein kinase [Spirillospora sp. CA-294931]|uniref:serine/threonine-protein kinase n=1 Tax=Spirillospora sp. CA-294931 TaxID=3240042 RepID=UPI003D92B6AC